ncbi:MAG: type IV pilus assembly protein PilM [Candidatus Omnitrophota bacterium]
MFKLGKTKEESVGLDIGSYSVKVAAIRKEAGENTLTAYDIKKIPLDQKDIKVEYRIREALDEINLHPDTVNLSISGPDVIVRFINLPKMNREQLQNAMVFEAEKYIPFNISEVVLDFIILGNAPEAGQMRVLLAAAKRETVESRVKVIEDLNMTVNAMDINPFAVFNAFTESYPLSGDDGNAFLDLGHSGTDVLVSIGEIPCFMRQIQIGGKDVADAICHNLSVSQEKAEEYKVGLGGPDKEAITQATVPILDDLITEVQLSFGYFENRYNKGVSNIYCSGGMIFQEGVADYLTKKLGIQVKKWNPVEGIGISENLSREDIDSVASQLAVSIGLALRD